MGIVFTWLTPRGKEIWFCLGTSEISVPLTTNRFVQLQYKTLTANLPAQGISNANYNITGNIVGLTTKHNPFNIRKWRGIAYSNLPLPEPELKTWVSSQLDRRLSFYGPIGNSYYCCKALRAELIFIFLFV